MTKQKSNQQTQKRMGVIRWTAVGPFILIVSALALYGKLFLDTHLRWGLEWGLTRANGAQVDVATLSTSFWRAELEIQNIDATDKESPTRNAWSLGRIYWKASWDALLRGKLVIEESSITRIALGSARKKPGRVLPPDPPTPENSPSWLSQLGGSAKDRLAQEVKENPLAQTAQSLASAGDPVALAKAQLKSAAEIERLSKSLGESEQRWRQGLSQLPSAQSLKGLESRIQAVQLPTDAKDVGKIQSTVRELQSLASEGSRMASQVQQVSQSLGGDVRAFQSQLQELDRLIQADMRSLGAGGGLSLDPKTLGKDIFQRTVGDRLGQAQEMINLSRRYMPAASEKKEPSRLVPRDRSQGVTYQFGRPNSYPLFWWKKAIISGSQDGSDFKGSMTDLTTDPPQVGRPLVLQLQGSMPAQGLRGMELRLTIDHVTPMSRESLMLAIASMTLEERQLLPHPPVGLDLRSGQLRTKTTLQAEGQSVTLLSENLLHPSQFALKAEPELVQTVLGRAFGELQNVTLNARMSGTWDSFALGVESNLGDQIQNSLNRQLQEHVNKAKAQVLAYVDKEIRPKQKQLQEQYSKIQGEIQKILGDSKVASEQPQKLAESKIRDSQGRAVVPQEAQKAVDDLKKRFKF